LSYTYSRVTIEEGTGTDDCGTNTFNGTWEIQNQTGSTIVIAATYVDNNNQERTMQLRKQGSELTYTDLLGQYPRRNAQGGAEFANGTVEYVFEK